ncbi:MAG: host attachment protein [Acidithiobacillus sp.]|uniref:host attachment protein n=1 Tax=Acidithiobacillus sp. TaxID=1872118 RepID=UPI003CFEC101
MTRTWILVSNGSHAKFFLHSGCGKGLQALAERHHDSSRLKGTELVSDAPGRVQQSFAHGARPALDGKSSPKDQELQQFARELAQTLREGRVQTDYDDFVLVAPPAFLGLLREALDEPTAKLQRASINKDYIQADLAELSAHLGRVLCV